MRRVISTRITRLETHLEKARSFERTEDVAQAFLFLDNEARAKFVYGASGTKADLERAREAFETIRSICEEAIK